MQRQRVREHAGLELARQALFDAILDRRFAAQSRLVPRELDGGERGIDPDDLEVLEALEQHEIRVTGATTDVEQAPGFTDAEHLERELAEQRQIARHHERLEDSGVGWVEPIWRKHAALVSSARCRPESKSPWPECLPWRQCGFWPDPGRMRRLLSYP